MSDAPSFNSTSYTPDRLIAGDKKLVTRVIQLTDNESVGPLTRGAVLGNVLGVHAIVHQTGSYPAATAGAILLEDADPSEGDVNALVYVEGEFNEEELSFGGTLDVDDVREILQPKGIHLKRPVSAV